MTNLKKLAWAITEIASGKVPRIDIDKETKVYKCKDVVRIDIKIPKEGVINGPPQSE